MFNSVLLDWELALGGCQEGLFLAGEIVVCVREWLTVKSNTLSVERSKHIKTCQNTDQMTIDH